MEEVPYYGLTWFVYLLLSACFFVFSFWHSRNMKFWLRIPILSLIAAMAFTPATTIQGEAFWSPAAIVMVFEIDQLGFAGFWRAGLAIIAMWVVFMIGSFLGRWLLNKRTKKATVSNTDAGVQSELSEPE